MNIKKDTNGQVSAELILILSAMSMIVLITAYYTNNILNDITNHTKQAIITGRDNILNKL